MNQAVDEISKLGDRVEVAIFFGSAFSLNSGKWHVNIKLKDGDIKVESDKHSPNLLDALEEAWGDILGVASQGLAPGALLPTEELIPKIKPPIDDEIPF